MPLTSSGSRNDHISINMWPCFGMDLTFYQASFLWLSKVHSPYPSHISALSILSNRTPWRKKIMNSSYRTPKRDGIEISLSLGPKHVAMIDRIFKKEIQRASPCLEQYQSDEPWWNHRPAELWSRMGGGGSQALGSLSRWGPAPGSALSGPEVGRHTSLTVKQRKPNKTAADLSLGLWLLKGRPREVVEESHSLWTE